MVAFLFTDVGRSNRPVAVDESGNIALAVSSHDELLRAAIEDWGGMIFSTMGDGIAAML